MAGKRGKKGLVWQTLIPWIIAVAILVLMVILFLLLREKGSGAIEYLKNIFWFGK